MDVGWADDVVTGAVEGVDEAEEEEVEVLEWLVLLELTKGKKEFSIIDKYFENRRKFHIVHGKNR